MPSHISHPIVSSKLQSWNVAAGNFFFGYRNALFPLIFALGALTLRPEVMFGSEIADRILRVCGIVLALLGQAVRLTTIGFEYIHRGGKDGQVHAGRLVRGGVYGIIRNPMYLGNGLIAVGMTMLLGSPLGYLILIPFFFFVYQTIVAAEEAYLRDKFGREYDDYAAAVNRFIPSLSRILESVAGMRFDWRRSVRKDLGTIVGLSIGLILIPAWRNYFLYGWEASKAVALRALWLSLAVTLIYFCLLKLKRSDRLFQKSTDPQ
jgi:protein-S-isoprenylcysteine O-methyltransferase Ste14